MPPLRRIIILTLFIAFVSALAYVFYPKHQFLTLPNGAVLKLETVTTNEAPFVYGNRLQKFLKESIPPKWAKLIGYKADSLTIVQVSYGMKNHLTLWFSCPNGSLPQPLGPIQDHIAKAIAEDGTEYENRFLKALRSRQPQTSLLCIKLNVFPRGQRQFGLRLYSQDGNKQWIPSSQITIENPLYAPSPKWTDSATPITNQIGEMDIVLKNVKYGLGLFERGLGNIDRPPSRPSSQFSIATISKSQSSPRWWIAKCVARDRHQNYQDFQPTQERKTGNKSFVSYGFLNPSDIWKIELHLLSLDSAGSPTDTLSLGKSEIGDAQELHSKVFNVPVRILRRRESIEVSLPSRPDKIDISNILIKDENGKEINAREIAVSEEHEFTVPAENLRNPTITVILQQKVKLEYFVKPTIADNKGVTHSFSTP